MIRVTGNSFPACVSVPMAVASIVSGFDLSRDKAEPFPRLSKQISSKPPRANLWLLGTEFLIHDIIFFLRAGNSFGSYFPSIPAQGNQGVQTLPAELLRWRGEQ